jgi:phage shock protein A
LDKITQSKSFWKRPEGVTGTIFLIGMGAAALYFGAGYLSVIQGALESTLGIIVTSLIIASVAFLAINKQSRNLISYSYRSVMRWITGIFVQLDPIAILRTYLDDMKKSLRDMSKQIGALKGQMRRLRTTIEQNTRDMEKNMNLASRAQKEGNQSQIALNARKAARLRDSNTKLESLYNRMEVLYRVLAKMYQNSEILYEDTKDQIKIKEQERKAIRASHSAMNSAMNIINGNSDQRAMFDQAMEALADDVASKVGEMERFMDVSKGFMDSIDLQNGVFEEEGLKMLEKWEKESTTMLMGDDDMGLLNEGGGQIDLNQEVPVRNTVPKEKGNNNQYTNLFD